MQLHQGAILRKQRRSKRSHDVKTYKLRMRVKMNYIKLNLPKESIFETPKNSFEVEVVNTIDCPIYTGILIENLKIDGAYNPLTIMALGYLDSPDNLEEPYKTRELTPRSRKSVEEISFFLNELS